MSRYRKPQDNARPLYATVECALTGRRCAGVVPWRWHDIHGLMARVCGQWRIVPRRMLTRSDSNRIVQYSWDSEPSKQLALPLGGVTL